MPKAKTAFTCKVCGVHFERLVWPSSLKQGTFEFCSPTCRNKGRTLSPGICAACGLPFKRKRAVRRFCSYACAIRAHLNLDPDSEPRYWTEERDQVLFTYYPSEGADFCADMLDISHKKVLYRVAILGLVLEKEAMRRIVHDAAAEHMTRNNPMRNEASKKKMQSTARKSEKAQNAKRKFFEGHQRLAKNKPSKLEQRLCAILNELGITYEHQYLIKSKFLVDIRIGNLIIQADGDYWHGHPRMKPLTERQEKQRARDRSQDKYLRSCGYVVERIWESDMSKESVVAVLRKHGLLKSSPFLDRSSPKKRSRS